MECLYCSQELPSKGFYCPNCAKQSICKNCNEPLEKDANACIYCATLIGEGKSSVERNSNNILSNMNTVKFKETKDSRSLDIVFSDNVAESVASLSGLITNKLSRSNSKMVIGEDIVEEKLETDVLKSNLLLEASTNGQSNPSNIDQNSKVNDQFDYPVINDVVTLDLPNVEWEWVLIYSFYASEFGVKSFTSNDIKMQYENTGRKTKTRYDNFTKHLKVLTTKKFIKLKNTTEYILLESGKAYANDVLDGKSTAKISPKSKLPAKSNSNNKEGEKKKSNNSPFFDLKFNLDEIQNLKDFFEKMKPKGQEEIVLILMKWFKDNKSKDSISLSEISYLFKIISITEPKALKQVFTNMKGQKNWVETGDGNRYKLTSIGELHIQDISTK